MITGASNSAARAMIRRQRGSSAISPQKEVTSLSPAAPASRFRRACAMWSGTAGPRWQGNQ